MLFQHDMTVVTVYDHEEDYQEIFDWLKENSSWFFPKSDACIAIITDVIEKVFTDKFGIVIGRNKNEYPK